MRIVKLEEFVKLPSGTVFQHWEPCIMDEIQIKKETLKSNNDFFYSQITIQPEMVDEDDMIYKYDGFGFRHSEIQSRWGMYDYDQLFLVYDDADVDNMIEMLKNRGK